MKSHLVSISALSLLLTGLATVPVKAQTPPATREIEVSGQGESRATPDLATLDIAVETHAGTAADAASQNAEISQKVAKELKTRLTEHGKIWTGSYNLYPDYSQPQPGESKPRITGYRADNSISIETEALNDLGQLIDTAITAGANRVNSLNFSLRDETKPRAEAIAKASRDAQGQAQALAAALGVKLKRIVRASTTAPRPVPVMGEARAMLVGRAPTPVQPGEVTVPATVTLLYEIE